MGAAPGGARTRGRLAGRTYCSTSPSSSSGGAATARGASARREAAREGAERRLALPRLQRCAPACVAPRAHGAPIVAISRPARAREGRGALCGLDRRPIGRHERAATSRRLRRRSGARHGGADVAAAAGAARLAERRRPRRTLPCRAVRVIAAARSRAAPPVRVARRGVRVAALQLRGAHCFVRRVSGAQGQRSATLANLHAPSHAISRHHATAQAPPGSGVFEAGDDDEEEPWERSEQLLRIAASTRSDTRTCTHALPHAAPNTPPRSRHQARAAFGRRVRQRVVRVCAGAGHAPLGDTHLAGTRR